MSLGFRLGLQHKEYVVARWHRPTSRAMSKYTLDVAAEALKGGLIVFIILSSDDGCLAQNVEVEVEVEVVAASNVSFRGRALKHLDLYILAAFMFCTCLPVV